ncbi:hypothetical protein BDQ17DRAFT_1371750 [Cyathus striatus]|nr:hypothetical protein BDQ17DRAFT_1371750 [Cyathus striatus]
MNAPLPTVKFVSSSTTNDNAIALRRGSPFDQVPTELVQEIFDRCFGWVPREPFYINGVVKYGQYITMTLSQVCQRWRQISLSMPHLWVYILVNNPDTVQLWLQRSRNAYIYVAAFPTTGKYDQAALDSFSSIANHAARWKVIDIYTERPISDIITSLNIENRHLEIVKLDASSLPIDSKLPLTDAVFRLISSSPHIRHIKLNSVSLPSFIDKDTWSRLTVISLNIFCHVTPEEVIQCLSMCTSAVDITFSNRGELSDPDTSNKVTLLPHLSSLDLSLYINNYGSFDCEALDRFHEQSKCYLTNLLVDLETDSLHDDAIGYLLRAPWIIDIQCVSIHADWIADEALLALLQNSDAFSKVKEKLTLRRGLIRWGR